MVAGGLVMLLMPIAFSYLDGSPIRPRWVVYGVIASLVFFADAYQSVRLRRNAQLSAPPS